MNAPAVLSPVVVPESVDVTDVPVLSTRVIAEPARVTLIPLPDANPVPFTVSVVPLTIPFVGAIVIFGWTVKAALVETA